MEEPAIRLVNVVKRMAGRTIADIPSWTVRGGEAIALVGGNGSGKSTLLRIAGGLTRPDRGTVTRTGAGRKLGYAPDRLPPLKFTAVEYLTHMARIRGVEQAGIESTVRGMLERFGLEHASGLTLDRYSKGMLQKVNLMQALLGDPGLLLLDEPLSGLDDATRTELLAHLNRLRLSGITLVIATHEQEVLTEVAERAVRLALGRIVSDSRAAATLSIRRIEAQLPPETSEDVYRIGAAMEGVLASRRRGETAEFRVTAAASDRLLRSLLTEGASILSVSPDKGGRP